jgi:hypothetical protein
MKTFFDTCWLALTDGLISLWNGDSDGSWSPIIAIISIALVTMVYFVGQRFSRQDSKNGAIPLLSTIFEISVADRPTQRPSRVPYLACDTILLHEDISPQSPVSVMTDNETDNSSQPSARDFGSPRRVERSNEKFSPIPTRGNLATAYAEMEQSFARLAAAYDPALVSRNKYRHGTKGESDRNTTSSQPSHLSPMPKSCHGVDKNHGNFAKFCSKSASMSSISEKDEDNYTDDGGSESSRSHFASPRSGLQFPPIPESRKVPRLVLSPRSSDSPSSFLTSMESKSSRSQSSSSEMMRLVDSPTPSPRLVLDVHGNMSSRTCGTPSLRTSPSLRGIFPEVSSPEKKESRSRKGLMKDMSNLWENPPSSSVPDEVVSN